MDVENDSVHSFATYSNAVLALIFPHLRISFPPSHGPTSTSSLPPVQCFSHLKSTPQTPLFQTLQYQHPRYIHPFRIIPYINLCFSRPPQPTPLEKLLGHKYFVINQDNMPTPYPSSNFCFHSLYTQSNCRHIILQGLHEEAWSMGTNR